MKWSWNFSPRSRSFGNPASCNSRNCANRPPQMPCALACAASSPSLPPSSRTMTPVGMPSASAPPAIPKHPAPPPPPPSPPASPAAACSSSIGPTPAAPSATASGRRNPARPPSLPSPPSPRATPTSPPSPSPTSVIPNHRPQRRRRIYSRPRERISAELKINSFLIRANPRNLWLKNSSLFSNHPPPPSEYLLRHKNSIHESIPSKS